MYYCFHGRKDNSLTVAMCLAIFFMANTVTDGQGLRVSAFMAGHCDSALWWLCVSLFMTVSPSGYIACITAFMVGTVTAGWWLRISLP